jgi:hypothetical protein
MVNDGRGLLCFIINLLFSSRGVNLKTFINKWSAIFPPKSYANSNSNFNFNFIDFFLKNMY